MRNPHERAPWRRLGSIDRTKVRSASSALALDVESSRPPFTRSSSGKYKSSPFASTRWIVSSTSAAPSAICPIAARPWASEMLNGVVSSS